MTADRTWWRGRGLGARWVSLEREEEPTAGPNFGSHSWMSFFPTARRSDEWRLLKKTRKGRNHDPFFQFKWFFSDMFLFIFWCQNMLGDIPTPLSCRCLHQGFDALMPSRGLIGGDWWRRQKQKKQRPGGVFWMKVQRELHRTTTLKINQLRWCAWRGF